MSAVLAELGGRFADRWAAVLVLPGLFYVLGAAAAVRLGHTGWADLQRLADWPSTVAAAGDRTASGWVALALALPVLSFIAAMAARGLAAILARSWFGTWLGPLGRFGERLTARRRHRWEQAEAAFQNALNGLGAKASAQDRSGLDALAAKRNAIALMRPGHPAWTGDRLGAVDARVWSRYKLDATFAWPRLWLLLDEAEQGALRAARSRLDAAVGLAGWSLMCLWLTVWWWPAALVAAVMFAVAHRQVRAAADVFAHLAEAVFDLRGGVLARELGFTVEGPLDPQTGLQVTAQLRKFA